MGPGQGIETLIGTYFLLSAVARLGECILLGGNPEYGLSALARGFIGYTFLPIH